MKVFFFSQVAMALGALALATTAMVEGGDVLLLPPMLLGVTGVGPGAARSEAAVFAALLLRKRLSTEVYRRGSGASVVELPSESVDLPSCSCPFRVVYPTWREERVGGAQELECRRTRCWQGHCAPRFLKVAVLRNRTAADVPDRTLPTALQDGWLLEQRDLVVACVCEADP